MCNLYQLAPKDWSNRWVQDAEPMVNIMPSYEVYGILSLPTLGSLAADLLTEGCTPENFRQHGLDPAAFSPARF